MYKYPTANNIQNATAAMGFLRNWSKETGRPLGDFIVAILLLKRFLNMYYFFTIPIPIPTHILVSYYTA
jgi:hypothetical protein